MSSKAMEQAFYVVPPQKGAFAALQVTTAVQVVDLTSLPQLPSSSGDPSNQNPIGHQLRITADPGGNAIYFATAATAAALANVSPTSYSSLSSNKLTLTGNEVDVIAPGAYKDITLPTAGTPQANPPPAGSSSPCRFLALITASSTGVARFSQVSP